MSKFTLPPNKLSSQAPAKKAAAAMNEKKVSAIINKGGSSTKTESVNQADEFKNFNIKILESELKAINDLRDKMPKPRGKRLGISLHDWIVSAVQEKIARDSKKV